VKPPWRKATDEHKNEKPCIFALGTEENSPMQTQQSWNRQPQWPWRISSFSVADLDERGKGTNGVT
jgi:hypothetical protein